MNRLWREQTNPVALVLIERGPIRIVAGWFSNRPVAPDIDKSDPRKRVSASLMCSENGRGGFVRWMDGRLVVEVALDPIDMKSR